MLGPCVPYWSPGGASMVNRIVTFGIMAGAAVLTAHRGPRWLRVWLVPAWLGILVLTLTQSFATTGYGPLVVGSLVVLPLLGYTDRRAAPARDHE